MTTATDNATTIAGYCNGAGITLTHKGEDFNDNAPQWALENGVRHYRVTLHYQGRQFSLWWYQGRGIDREPTAADVLENLLSDYSMKDYALDDYVSDLGYEIKSIADYRNLIKLQQTIKRYAKSLDRLIGNPDLMAALLAAL